MIIYMIATAFGVLAFCIVFIKINDFAQRHDQVKRRLGKVYSTTMKSSSVDEEFSKPLAERFIKPLFKAAVKNLQKYLPEEKNSKSSLQIKQANKLKGMLRQAGMKIGVNQYLKIRFVVMAATGVIFAMIGMTMNPEIQYILFAAAFGVYASYAVFRFVLARKITQRRNAMQRQLPDVLDMLSVSVEAGLGLEQAMIQVVNHFNGPLIDEIAVANREMAMGRNRKDALLLLGDRCEINEMKTFVRAIVQASQLGISIKNVLRSQAALMRQTRKNKIEEKAMKVSVKILLPMAIFIFPVLFIVLLGPAVVNIAENLM